MDKKDQEIYNNKASQITELLSDLKVIHTKYKGVSDNIGLIHMMLDYEEENFDLVILGSQHIFRTMIYNFMHENEDAAQDIMEIVEAYRNEKFN